MFAIIAELGWPIWPLILASILALALIIERAIALQRRKIVPATLLNDVLGIWKKRQITPDVIAKLEGNSALGRVLAAGLRNERTSREGAMQQIEAAGAVVANRLTKNLTLLGSIGSIAPLLGLLGTVVGMIDIFVATHGSIETDAAFEACHGTRIRKSGVGLHVVRAQRALEQLRCHIRIGNRPLA